MKLNKKYLPSPLVILIGLFAFCIIISLYNTPPPVFLRPYLSWAGPFAGVIFGSGWAAVLLGGIIGLLWIIITYDAWRRS